MELKLEPSILKTLIGANPKLQFLNDCLSYLPEDRPSATILSRRLNQLSMESKEFIDVFIMKMFIKLDLAFIVRNQTSFFSSNHSLKMYCLIGFKIYSFTGTKESLFPSKSSIVEFPVSGSSGRHLSGSAKSGSAHSTTSRVERQTGWNCFCEASNSGKIHLVYFKQSQHILRVHKR